MPAHRYRPRHARSSARRIDRTSGGSALLVAGGALLLAVALPAVVRGLQPVPVAAAPSRVGILRAAAPPAAGTAPAERVAVVPEAAAVAVSRSPSPAAVLRCHASGTSSRNPTRVSVPAIGVDACVSGLGLARDGSMRVPAEPETVGWYHGGPRPGRPGAALLVGHVDSTEGPAAFFGLRNVSRGDVVHVRDGRGRRTTFVVYRVAQYQKDAFPTDRVFRGVTGAELRLITCSGSFDKLTRRYSHNLVVYARLAPGAAA